MRRLSVLQYCRSIVPNCYLVESVQQDPAVEAYLCPGRPRFEHQCEPSAAERVQQSSSERQRRCTVHCPLSIFASTGGAEVTAALRRPFMHDMPFQELGGNHPFCQSMFLLQLAVQHHQPHNYNCLRGVLQTSDRGNHGTGVDLPLSIRSGRLARRGTHARARVCE